MQLKEFQISVAVSQLFEKKFQKSQFLLTF